MLLCPNKNHEDWKYSVEKLGEDKTLFIYDLLGQEIPSKEQIDILVDNDEFDNEGINNIKSGVDYTTVTTNSRFEGKQQLLDNFNILQSKSHYYYVLTKEEQESVDKYLFKQGGKKKFGKTSSGFIIYDGVKGTVTYKIVGNRSYLFIDYKEYKEEDGIKIPRYVGSFKVPIDLVFNTEEETYLKNQKDNKEYIPYIEKEINKYLFKTKGISVKKSSNFYVLQLNSLIIKLYKKLFDKDITYEDLKNISYDEAEKLYESVDFKVAILELQEEYKNIINNTNVNELKDNLLKEISIIYSEDEIVEFKKLLDYLPDSFIKLLSFSITTNQDAYMNPQGKKNKRKNKFNRDDIQELTKIENLRYGIAINVTLRRLLDKGVISQDVIKQLNDEIKIGIEKWVKLLTLIKGVQTLPNDLVPIRAKFFSKKKALQSVLSKDQLSIYLEEFSNVRMEIEEYLNNTSSGLSHLVQLITANSGVNILNLVFTDITLGDFSNHSKTNFIPDNLTIAGHEIGHAIDMYLATTNPSLRKGIIGFINELITPEDSFTDTYRPEFKEYIEKGLESRGYDISNKKEIVADIFAYISLKAIGADVSKGHLLSLDNFFKNNEKLVHDTFTKYIIPEYYEKYYAKDVSKINIFTLFQEIFNSIISAINKLIGKTVFNPITGKSKTITTNLTGVKYNIGDIFSTLNRVIQDESLYDINNILKADPELQKTWNQYGSLMKVSDKKQSFVERMNSRIENGMYKQRDGKLVPITPSFNPEVWEVENNEKLVTGVDQDGRHETLFKFRDGLTKVGELNKQYKGKFKFSLQQTVFPAATVARSKNPSPDNKPIYKIVVTQNMSLKSSIINDLDVNNAIKDTDQLVSDVLETLENKTIEQAIDIINDLEVSDEIKTLLNLFKTKLDGNPGLKLVIDNEKIGDYGEYDPFTNSVILYSRSHLSGASVTLDNLGITLVHELLHSFTVRAFYNNYSEKEKEFVNTIERLFKIAKKQTKWGKTPAYDEAAEWIAYVLTKPGIMKEAMGMKLNLWQRILTSVKKLLGITSVYDHAFNTVVEYISNGTIFTPNPNYIKKFKRSMAEDIHVQDNPTHKSIWEKLNSFANQFEFNDVDHTYKHLSSDQFFYSTTEELSKIKITSGTLSNDPEIREKQLARRSHGANIGTVIHGIAEADLKEIAINIARANGYSYDPIVVKKIEQILKQFKRPGVTILSEVLVADLDLLLAGTIDMIIIDENNQVHIYDFKNKEKGFADYLKPKRFGGSIELSDKERHSIQISIYSDMFEKMTGLNVASLNIIQLKPTVVDSIVTDIELDKTHSPNGIVSVDYNHTTNLLYSYLKIKQGKSIRDDFEQDKVDPETRKQLDDELKSKIKQLQDNVDELSDKEKIVYKSIESLIHKKQVLYRSGKKHEIATQEKLIDDLIAETDVEKQLIKILEYANSNALRIWSEYIKYKDAGKQLPLTLLYGWKDSVNAFNAMLDEQDGLNSILTDEFGFKGGPKYRDLLKSTMEIVAQIKGLYETQGLDQLVDFLAPFYNRMYAEERLIKIKEYRRKKFNGEIPDGVTEEQYVDKSIDENEETLQQRTKTMMRKELKKASRDIGVLTRWIDNLLDTTDPVTAAMVKAFVFADEEARIAGLENRDEMVSMVRKLEDWYKQNGRIPKSNEEFYSFMLEKIDGKLTGHYINPYISDMMREYRDIVSASRNLETSEQRKEFIKAWLDGTDEYPGNMPLQKEAFKTAFWDFIETQYAVGNISDQEFSNLDDNNYAKNKLTVGEMVEKGIITFETGDILGTWLNENTWDYRVPVAKWANPQYAALNKIINDPNDVRGEFYKHVVKLRREADSMLPFGYRLDSRLPGVVKQNHERIASGQSAATTIKQALSRQLTFQVDDTNRIHEEILDEAGNAKYFLPIHFTGKVVKDVTKVTSEGEEYIVKEFDEDEQSFDIATIYHKYWTMANDYNTKNDILPQMEMAKFMINKRKAIKRDSVGNRILRKKSRRSGNADTPEEDVTINNTYLAEQVNDWFLSCVYGVQEKDAGKWGKIDVGKLLNFINSYTSLNLLGLNFVAGTANVILGETMQRIESFAYEYMKPTDFWYADKFYLRTMKGAIGDIGARDTTGLATHITEQFGIFGDYGESDMDRRTKLGQMANMNTLYFTSHLGEQYMQSRFLFGLLANKRAYNSEGKDIGRMLDMYELKDNKLVIKPEVDLVKSKWTDGSNGTKDYQGDFKIKIRGILSRLHGEYGTLGKVAIQRMALGRMAYLFRHFVVPGFRRRWGTSMWITEKDPITGIKTKKLNPAAYNERLGQFVEGNYITTGKFVGALGGKIFGKTEENKELLFFNRLIGNLQSFKLSMFGEEWASLTDHEKANVHRTLYEVGFLILAVILANMAMAFKGDADDDDDKFAQMYWSFIAYQTYRLQNELMFFTPKLDSAMSIMRSPAASFSFVESLIKLSGQVFHPTEVYESGPWKGRPKILKTINDMTPLMRQYYRIKDIEVQLPWMQKSSLSGRPEQGEEQYGTPPQLRMSGSEAETKYNMFWNENSNNGNGGWELFR